jgi:hypothetical protein
MKKKFQSKGRLIKYLNILFSATRTRDWVLVALFLISVTLVISLNFFMSNHGISDGKNKWIFSSGIAISSSIVTAILLKVIDQTIQNIDQSNKKRRFLRIFSYSDNLSITEESTVIVIPAFRIRNIRTENSDQNSNLKTRALENLSNTPTITKAAIKNDVVAGLYIASLFSKLNLPTPQIAWDEEVQILNDDTEKTYILIGLSNSLIDILEKWKIPEGTKLYSINSEKRNDFNSFFIKCGRFYDSLNLQSDKEWTRYPGLSPDSDYAIFAKYTYGKKTIIICGGTTEESTNSIGQYINRNWEKIYRTIENEKRGNLNPDDSFTIIVKTQNEQHWNDFIIVNKCIRPLA